MRRPRPTSLGLLLLWHAELLRRLCKHCALLVDRLGELRRPAGVGNLSRDEQPILDDGITIHHRLDV